MREILLNEKSLDGQFENMEDLMRHRRGIV